MSKLREHLTEGSNNNPDSLARSVDATFEDILFQLENIADMKAVNFNVSKKLRRSISDLIKISTEVSKSIREGV